MFVTNWISTTKIQKISEITNFFRHYFLSRTEVSLQILQAALQQNSLLVFQTTKTQQLTPESSSSQEQLRQEHLLLPIKLSFLLFLREQDRGALQKT